ncbi:MAG: hypothetical protein ABGW77_05255 [Campylobacterales bacterium]
MTEIGEGWEREEIPKLLYLTYTPQLKGKAIEQIANIIKVKKDLRDWRRGWKG